MSSPASASEKSVRWAIFCALVALGYAYLSDLDATPYDDSYFFVRTARNLLRDGVLAFNVADGPVYGNTSQSFQLVVVLLAAAFDQYSILATRAFNGLCLLSAMALLLLGSRSVSKNFRGSVWIAVYAVASVPCLAAYSSGMETAFTLLLLVIFGARFVRTDLSSRESALWTVTLYLTRPDAALMVFICTMTSHVSDKARCVRYLSWVAGLMIPLLFLFGVLYGAVVPLSFFAKTHGLGGYGAHMSALGWKSKFEHAGLFTAVAAPLLTIAFFGSTNKARSLLSAALGFVAYHLAFTHEIMGYLARFYTPAIALLAWSAILAWDDFLARSSATSRRWIVMSWLTLLLLAWSVGVLPLAGATASRALPLSILASLGALVPLMRGPTSGDKSWPAVISAACLVGSILLWKGTTAAENAADLAVGPTPRLSDPRIVARHADEATSFRGIYAVEACLSGAMQIYHSELGVPGLVLPAWRIVDLVGIQNPEPMRSLEDIDQACMHDQPEAIFLPHRNYQALNHLWRDSSCLRDYVRVVRRSSSPLYVRSDLSQDFLKCAQQRGFVLE